MPAPRDTATIVRAARLYYEQDRSQAQIAQELGLSRSNVSRILTQARDRGIVEISIHDPEGPPQRSEALESALRSAFHLEHVHVVHAPRTSGLEAVAREGAILLAERSRQVSSIGVSWGQTVQSVVEHLEPQSLRPAPTVLPLVGGHSALDEYEAGESVLRMLASRLGSRPRMLYAPAVLESPQAAATLRGESSISSVLDAASSVELALVGMGSMGHHSSPQLVRMMRLTEPERTAFGAQHPVGDVCGRFVDAQGRPLGAPTDDRVLAVPFERLQAIPDVVGVAAGIEKAPGVSGVLRSGVIDTVVVDDELARGLLDLL